MMIRTLEVTATRDGSHSNCPVALTQLEEILERACRAGVDHISLLSTANSTTICTVCSDGERSPTHDPLRPTTEAWAPVLVTDTAVAQVVVRGAAANPAPLEQTALLVAAQIADAWRSAQDLNSLSQEIVHAYEELHLLYELGEAFTGQLTTVQVADLLLDKILQALPAARGEVYLGNDQRPFHHRAGTQADLFEDRDVARSHRLSTTLRSGGRIWGSIVLVRASGAEPFSSADIKLLDAIGAFAGNAIRNVELYQHLLQRATTDPLTGLANHRTIQERLDEELARARRSAQSLAVMLIDIDDFKLFNDTYGHLVGDQILRLTSKTLREACRDGVDLVGRYGGDEFAVLLPQTGRAEAEAIAGRILDAIRAQGIPVAGHEALPLALSIGCAVFPDDATLKHDLLGHADAALYEVKHCGGNGVHRPQESLGSELIPTTTFDALQGLVTAVDAKDRYTREHSETVTEGALLLARHLGLSSEVCSALRVAGLLHDVGKIGIPDRILRKPGRLNEDEYKIMQQHVALSELIIKEVPHLVDVLGAVASHHERYDGKGYPRGLRGEEIPLLGRIMALADAASAMLLDRPYRKGLTWNETKAELRRGSGTQFDPLLVEPFIVALEQSSYLHTRQDERKQHQDMDHVA